MDFEISQPPSHQARAGLHLIGRLILILLAAGSGLVAQSPPKSDPRVDALAKTPGLGAVYSDDGAADGTVMVSAGEQGPVENPIPAVKAIVDLGDKALPLLVGCLSDTRLTSATMTFQHGNAQAKPVPVPVGYFCLDILTNIVVPNTHIFVDSCPPQEKEGDAPCCNSDGLGACINKGFYFRPDDYVLSEGGAVAHPLVLTAQSNWRKAYDAGWLKYEYPAGWRQPK
jgi:hypothetical protein